MTGISDHLSINVTDYARSKAFALEPDGHNVETVFHG
jgi:hypothetical protein